MSQMPLVKGLNVIEVLASVVGFRNLVALKRLLQEQQHLRGPMRCKISACI